MGGWVSSISFCGMQEAIQRSIPSPQTITSLPESQPTLDSLSDEPNESHRNGVRAFIKRGEAGGVQSTDRETGRDKPQCAPSPEEIFTRQDLELPILRDLSKLLAALHRIHGYLCTPVLPVANTKGVRNPYGLCF